jgi:hypothetical protein
MIQTAVVERGSEQTPYKNAIRPFHANFPETELTELQRRINATKGRSANRSRMHLKACNLR